MGQIDFLIKVNLFHSVIILLKFCPPPLFVFSDSLLNAFKLKKPEGESVTDHSVVTYCMSPTISLRDYGTLM